MNEIEISSLIGKTFVDILVSENDDEILFVTDQGERYKMYHDQECCEDVAVEEIIGDLSDLLNNPILIADERTEIPTNITQWDSATWTFYEFATIKGSVTIRWYGTSNGYYSEAVEMVKLNN